MCLSGLPIVNKFAPRLAQQRGFSLLEIMAALAIGMLMMASLTAMVDSSLQDTKGQQTAQYQAQFSAAASRYLNDKAIALQASVSASPGGTYAVNLAALKPAYLPAAFAPTNAYRQTPCMLVRGTATANQLDALIVTEAGDPIPVKDIGYVAANAGTGGGSIRLLDTNNPTSPVIAQGAYLSWQLDNPAYSNFTSANCSGTAATVGRMATILSYGGPNAINRDVLFRNPSPTDPTLNQMNTTLGFTASAMKAIGDTCGAPGITLETGTANVLKCNTTTNLWEPSASKFWKDPVATFAALPGTTVVGEVRMALDTGRAFMFNGGAWKALAIDENNNFTVPNGGNLTVSGNATVGTFAPATGAVIPGTGTINAGNINSTLDVVAGQDMRAARDIQANRDLIALNDIRAGRNIDAIGNINSQNNVTATNAMVAGSVTSGTKNVNDPCNFFGPAFGGGTVVYMSAGTVVTDTKGRIMECQPNNSIMGSGGTFIYVDGTSPTAP